jgi:FtsH-binding integral membrane protein
MAFPVLKHWIGKHGYVGITLGIVAVVLLYAMVCYPQLCRKVPTNYILLGLFTLCLSYCVSSLAASYSLQTVWIAAVATFGTVLALTIYACLTDDIGYALGLLSVATVVAPFLVVAYIYYPTYWMTVAISGLCCIFAAIYIVASTKMIVGGSKGLGGVQFSMDDYIMAAMAMYINIISLFMEILVITGAANS